MQDMYGAVKQAIMSSIGGVGLGIDTSSIPPSDALPLGCDGVIHVKAETRNGTPTKVKGEDWLCAEELYSPSPALTTCSPGCGPGKHCEQTKAPLLCMVAY